MNKHFVLGVFMIFMLLTFSLATSNLIILNNPVDGQILNTNPVFSFTTNANATNCSLYINDSITDTINDIVGNSQYNLSSSVVRGVHSWFIKCSFNKTSETREFTFDDVSPQIAFEYPLDSSTISTEDINVTISVSETSECRLDQDNDEFEDMSKLLYSNPDYYWYYLVDLKDDDYSYNIRCKDLAGNIDHEVLDFTVRGPIEGVVDIETNTDDEDHYFLPKGRKPLEFKLSRRLDDAPTLYYQYEDETKHTVALTGNGKVWHGYVIIDSRVNDKVATFSASYDNEPIEITEGLMFVVDSQEPPAPETLQGIEKNGGVMLEWYYDGEEVDYYNVHRANDDRINHLDLLVDTTNQDYKDNTVESGVTYYYRITAIDLAGNEGPFSQLFKITTGLEAEEVQKVNPKVITKLNLTGKLIESLVLDLENAKTNLASITELKTKTIVEDFNLIGILDLKLKELEGFKAKILESYDQPESAVDSLIEEIAMFEAEVKSTVASTISFEGATTKTQTKDDFSSILLEFVQLDDPTKFNDEISKINELIEVEFSVEIFRLTMLDNSKKEIAKVEKTISYIGTNSLEDVKLIESIPKEIAESTSQLKIQNLDYEVLKEDPIISWEIASLGSTPYELSYYVQNEFDLEALDYLISFIIPNIPKETPESPATGLVTNEINEKFAIHEVVLSLLSLVIVSLLLYYYVFAKSTNLIRTDFSLGGMHKPEFTKLLKKGHSLIDSLNYSASKQLYVYLRELMHTEIGELTTHQKSGIKELHSKLTLFRTIAKAQGLLEEKKYVELTEMLGKLQPLMLKLKLTGKESKLTNYLTHWYYHYVNIVDYKR